MLRMKTFIRGDAVQRPFDIRCVGQHPSGPPGERLGQHRKRADVAFARREMSTLPPNALVLTYNPSLFHLRGINAAQMSLASTDPGYVSALRSRYAGGVVLHWNFWCNVADPVQQAFCMDVLNGYSHALMEEHRDRDYRYAFYRLVLPTSGAQ